MTWADTRAARIWRSPLADFEGDEPLESAAAYRDEMLAGIAAQGFNGIWLRARLYHLLTGQTAAELSDGREAERFAALHELILRAEAHGIKVWLFLTEPLALDDGHPFWQARSQWKGGLYHDAFHGRSFRSLCTSHPEVREFLDQSFRSLLSGLPGLGGVILITASEDHTHCYSHHMLRDMGDGFIPVADAPVDCPRCASRTPSEVVLDLLGLWAGAARGTGARVVAWNWSWSMWYEDPQSEIVSHLPHGVELLVDFERGGSRSCGDLTINVDEYSLAYAGPGKRFLESAAAARTAGSTVLAKIQIGTTHEIATVPNIPLLLNLHEKYISLDTSGAAGVMATWALGCDSSINTFSLGLYCSDPVRYRDADAFCEALGVNHFGAAGIGEALRTCWERWARAFAFFPFTTKFLYFGPVNAAPSRPLVARYRGAALRPNWVEHEDYGDRYDDCMAAPFTLESSAAHLRETARQWSAAANDFTALVHSLPGSPEFNNRRFQEVSCARMIGHQLHSAACLLEVHSWRKRKILELALTPPCDIPCDEILSSLLDAEISNLESAQKLAAADSRLGFHGQSRTHQYSAESIAKKIEGIKQWAFPER